jgi:hypothetical protein
MPDPIEPLIANRREVLRLWNKLPPAADNRDVRAPDPLPMSSRVARCRARYAGMSDGELAERGAVGIIAQVNGALDREEEKTRRLVRMQESRELREAEEKDRLIVLPRRGDDVEDGERWDEAFDGQRK